MNKIKIRIINKSKSSLPTYQTEGAAGMDLYANLDEPVIIEKGKIKLIPTGLFIALPLGYEAQIRSRSGMTLKHGIVVANGIGTIDCDYRGEIQIILINLGEKDYTINPGERIAQMVINQYSKAVFEEVEVLDDTLRGEGGFGHSGV